MRARINVQGDSGITVANNGSIYFADSGNGRVREILPNRIINTVAGGGTRLLGLSPMPALRVSLKGVAGLTIGPNAELYIAANSVYRLGTGGILHWVVGKTLPPKDLPKNWGGVYSNPAIQSDFTPAIRLAFDARGDLLVAGGPGGGLYEMTKSRKLRFIEPFWRGGLGSLAQATGGSVVLTDMNGVFSFSSSKTKSMGTYLGAIHNALTNGESRPNFFMGGGGVAVAKNGDIYVDTSENSAWSSMSAILELRSNGSVVALADKQLVIRR